MKSEYFRSAIYVLSVKQILWNLSEASSSSILEIIKLLLLESFRLSGFFSNCDLGGKPELSYLLLCHFVRRSPLVIGAKRNENPRVFFTLAKTYES